MLLFYFVLKSEGPRFESSHSTPLKILLVSMSVNYDYLGKDIILTRNHNQNSSEKNDTMQGLEPLILGLSS